MLLNEQVFYERLSEYGKARDYAGAEAYLKKTEKDIKLALAPNEPCG